VSLNHSRFGGRSFSNHSQFRDRRFFIEPRFRDRAFFARPHFRSRRFFVAFPFPHFVVRPAYVDPYCGY
jgi:hypothetical protein